MLNVKELSNEDYYCCTIKIEALYSKDMEGVRKIALNNVNTFILK